MVEEFVRSQRRRGMAPGTIVRRRDQLLALEEACQPKGLLELSSEEIEAFLDGRAGREGAPLSARTRYLWISNLSAFYSWAIRAGLTDADPTARIDRPKLRQNLPRPASDADVARAVELAPSPLRAWLLLMALGGLRCAEVAGLEREDLLEADGLLRVVGKGRKERLVPLHDEALSAMRAGGLPRSGPIFRQPDGRPYPPYRVSQLTNRYLRSIGIDATAHQLRHRFATAVYRASGGDLLVVRDLLGHASVSTTQVYTAFDRADARKAVEAAGLLDAASRPPAA